MQTTPMPQPQDDLIFDVSMEEFETKVMHASMEGPVLLDFWAPWCAPCKQLMPILEQAINNAGGAVKMAKVNIDDNQQLAMALQVQSVPTVFMFFQGQPIDAFTGMKSPSEIKAFIDKAISMSGATPQVDIPAVLKEADEALANDDLQNAQQLYFAVIQEENENPAANAGMLRVMIKAEALEQAAELAENLPEAIKSTDEVQAALKVLELAQNKPDSSALDALQKKLDKNPEDHQVRYDLACALFSADSQEDGMALLLDILRADREWNESAAKAKILEYFDLLGMTHPLTVSTRKKMSSILFS
jgi:putative thioredoxin